MASGMDLLLKSFGVDPEQIKSAVEGMGKGVIQVKERLDRIDARLENILRILEDGRTTEREANEPAAGDDNQGNIAGQ